MAGSPGRTGDAKVVAEEEAATAGNDARQQQVRRKAAAVLHPASCRSSSISDRHRLIPNGFCYGSSYPPGLGQVASWLREVVFIIGRSATLVVLVI